ncbi:FMN-dependent NADH-azoreductase [Streptomyces profundus]|uniref:FMN-dependent NADH-azoreductase n=1 Tax=Streptomyces profundus TaxID=2867410 RepID=UPI001D16F235|nr:NAD(P)H-dependent oxidoreductase [Streptomyces sp. MA3_2.13]UED82932.1 NAD(P)H-dependent oxidoreductase [Streptomyces sp. MA3_2.13]
MSTLLHLDSSARGKASESRAITAAFASAFRTAHPDNVVLRRDLHTDPPPHLPEAGLHWAPGLREAGERPGWAAEEAQRRLVNELLAADVLLIGFPLYNYGLPSTLKAWLDHVHVPGWTAPSAISGAPLAGRPVVLATARGGEYGTRGVNRQRDHATPVMELVLGEEMGMSVTVIAANLTLANRTPALARHTERAARELRGALSLAVELGGRLGSGRP